MRKPYPSAIGGYQLQDEGHRWSTPVRGRTIAALAVAPGRVAPPSGPRCSLSRMTPCLIYHALGRGLPRSRQHGREMGLTAPPVEPCRGTCDGESHLGAQCTHSDRRAAEVCAIYRRELKASVMPLRGAPRLIPPVHRVSEEKEQDPPASRMAGLPTPCRPWALGLSCYSLLPGRQPAVPPSFTKLRGATLHNDLQGQL
jgi:hypothetical protein